jgi:DNA-binding transcriptional regulator YdaS (Cro superfamily)
MTTESALERAVRVVGGNERLATAIGRSPAAFSNWKSRRVPAECCPSIERETRRCGDVVTCEELRPDVAWHVLRHGAQSDAA